MNDEYDEVLFWSMDAPRWQPIARPVLTPDELREKAEALQALFYQWTAAGERFRK